MSRGYRHSIKIQRDTSAAGVQDPVYTDLFNGIPCLIKPRNSFERDRGRQIEAVTTHIIFARWIDGFKANDIAVNEVTGVEYLIVGIINVDESNRDMKIFCNEKTV